MKYLLLGVAFLFAVPAYATTVSGSATMCTMEYAPVCGYKIMANNQCVGDECKVYKTYGNQCMLSADGAKYAHAGECTGNEIEEDEDVPDKPATPPKADTPEAYTPPTGCIAWYDGCNSCSMSGGGAVCTLRACFAYEPGYCTKWDETPIPVEPNGGIGISPNDDGVPVAVEADAEAEVKYENASFFTRIWLSILSWL